MVVDGVTDQKRVSRSLISTLSYTTFHQVVP